VLKIDAIGEAARGAASCPGRGQGIAGAPPVAGVSQFDFLYFFFLRKCESGMWNCKHQSEIRLGSGDHHCGLLTVHLTKFPVTAFTGRLLAFLVYNRSVRSDCWR
jgi:hypothetical protein